MSAAPANLVLVSPEELERLVHKAVREALAEREEPEEWLDTAQAAKVLKVHRRTVARLVRENGLPAHRIGKLFRFSRPAIVDWLEQRKTTKRRPDGALTQ